MKYELEKSIWTEIDFEQMGWHDCRIYKIRLTEDLEFDIDYILKWNKPDLEGLSFTFWVAPATLVFKKPTNLTFDLDTTFASAVEIENIERELTSNGSIWTIITHQGDLEFRSEGYEQFIRQEPSYQLRQTIPFPERYGISLERTTKQDNPNKFRDDLVEQRKKDFEHYENLKKRHLKRQEKEELNKLRDNNLIGTKEYILTKKKIEQMIDFYDDLLKDTTFESW